MAYLTSRSLQISPRIQPNYSPDVQRAIDAAFERLRRATSDAETATVHVPLNRYVAWSMSREQRMDLFNLLGESYAAQGRLLDEPYVAQGRTKEALSFFDDALSISQALGDWTAFVDIAERLGSFCRCIELYSSAVTYHTLALDALREHTTTLAERDFARECLIVAHLASHATLRGHLHVAKALFAEAEHLSKQVAQPGLEQGVLAWSQAVHYQWRGNPDRALRYAQQACSFYAEHGLPYSLARIHMATADIALTIAESYPAYSTARAENLDLAKANHEAAAKTGTLAQDVAGTSLHLLSTARFLRASGDNSTRLPYLLNVAIEAKLRSDAALEGQTFAELASDMVAIYELGSARTMYVRALDALRNTGMNGHADVVVSKLVALDDTLASN